jgi:hypothetical protein
MEPRLWLVLQNARNKNTFLERRELSAARPEPSVRKLSEPDKPFQRVESRVRSEIAPLIPDFQADQPRSALPIPSVQPLDGDHLDVFWCQLW